MADKSWKTVERELVESLAEWPHDWVQTYVDPLPLPDVTTLSRDQLLRCFPGPPKEGDADDPRSTLNDTRMVRVLLWQMAVRMRAGEIPRLNGNMRTAWYRHIEPFYLEKDLLASDVGPALDLLEEIPLPVVAEVLTAVTLGVQKTPLLTMLAQQTELSQRLARVIRERYLQNLISDVFGELYVEGLFDFADDFGLIDPGESRRFIGRNRARLMLFTEKDGLRWLCEYANKTHGISAMASRGESSLLDLYYLYKKFPKKVRTLDIGAITDYDPWGFLIADNIRDKLLYSRFFGPRKVNLSHLDGNREALEKLFTLEELRRGRRDLKQYDHYKQGEVQAWVHRTGGINGDYGIHIDLAPPEKLQQLVDAWVAGA